MTTSPLFDEWRAETVAGWGRQAFCLRHHLHESPLFGDDSLAELIERMPRSSYELVLTSQGNEARKWREGDVGDLSGRQVIDAIAEGSMWLNLREVQSHHAGFAALLDRAYGEMKAHVPGFDPRDIKMGILISSPRVRVHYHCDLPGQMLWQIRGRKRVYLYPTHPPFLDDRAIEDIAYAAVEFRLPYESSFDASAAVFDIGPGQMLTWPQNAPHRIDNEDGLSVSVTTEFYTEPQKRSQQVHLANAVLRNVLGVSRPRVQLDGPAYWAKAALQAAWRRSPWSHKVRKSQRPLDFRLAPGAPGGYVDIPPYFR